MKSPWKTNRNLGPILVGVATLTIFLPALIKANQLNKLKKQRALIRDESIQKWWEQKSEKERARLISEGQVTYQ